MTFDLKTARINDGHSIRSLAAKLDVHQSSIAALERGEAAHPATAKKIADHFKVKVTDLMSVEQAA